MGRVKIVSAPERLPGKCGLCGTATSKKGFLDTSLSYDFFGALYFCYNCITEMGDQFGLLNEEKSSALTAQLASTKKELEETKEALNELDRLRSYLSTAKHIVDTTDNTVVSYRSDRKPSVETLAGAGRGNKKTN